MPLAHPIAQMHNARAARCRTKRATIEIEREDSAYDEGEQTMGDDGRGES